MKKYDIDENYFEKIDSPEKAYLLGLIYADGCNYTPTNTVTLCLQEQDKHILEDIKELLHYNAPLKKIKPKKESHQISFVLTIHSKKISTDLTALGVMQNKTFKITFPDINKDLFSHFIRGYFDGDGCISKTGRGAKCNIVSSYDFNLTNNVVLQLSGGVKNIFNSYQNDFDSGVDRDSEYIYGPIQPRTIFFALKLFTK